MEAGLLKQMEVSNILNCERFSVYQNDNKYKSLGAKGLVDNRKGQDTDYKFSQEVKCEIIKGFLLCILRNEIPTKTTIRNYLNGVFPETFSERAVALHLNKIGLTDNKEKTIAQIAQQINNRIATLEYLEPQDQYLEPMGHMELLRTLRERLNQDFDLKKAQTNFFELEQKVESIYSFLHARTLKLLVNEIQGHVASCPNCHSSNSEICKTDQSNTENLLTTSLGSNFILAQELFFTRQCSNCKTEFDLSESQLKLEKQTQFSPLTQKKICSSNRAGSYENGVKNLQELTNLTINRNQVRKISNRVGDYIDREFQELYKDIEGKLSADKISQRHPLVKELKINRKYLDKSKYLITFAIDGGRMQLYNWIPPDDENNNGHKNLYWHENKVFRISIYDKTRLDKIPNKQNGSNSKQLYEAAKLISGTTTYGATNASWKDTVPLVISHLYIRGIRPDNVEICLSDGSEHILNEILKPVFPSATHILDYYHKAEGLHECLKALDIEEKMRIQLKNYLWEGKTGKLINELKIIQLKVGIPEGKRNTNDPKVKLDNFINHIIKNKNRIKYNQYREEKYPIGSGSIESAVKLFGKRIKGTEKQWSEDGGEAILNLYAFLLSEDNRWDKLWQLHTPWL